MLNIRQNRGFTLIELSVSFLVIIVLSGIILGMLSRSRDFSKATVCINNIRQISFAIENYQADWQNNPPPVPDLLYPQYVKSTGTFWCPADKSPQNPANQIVTDSYANFYIARPVAESDANKIFLVCNRHFHNSKTIAAYLSYATESENTQAVLCNSVPVDPTDFGNKIFKTGDVLTFVDGTAVQIENDSTAGIGIHSSFEDNQGKIYSVIYVPDAQAGGINHINVNQPGTSEVEVVTPAVIIDVTGICEVTTNWTADDCNTNISMTSNQPDSAVVKITVRNGKQSHTIKKGQSENFWKNGGKGDGDDDRDSR